MQVQIIITLEGDADAVEEIVEGPVYLPSQKLIAEQYEKHTGLKVISWATVRKESARKKRSTAPFPKKPMAPASHTNPASIAQRDLISKLEKLHQAPARLIELDDMSSKDASDRIDLLVESAYKWDLRSGSCYKIDDQTYMVTRSKTGRFYARWWDGKDWIYERTYIERLLLAVQEAGITDISTIEVVHP